MASPNDPFAELSDDPFAGLSDDPNAGSKPVRTDRDRSRNRANAARMQRELEEEERLKSSGVQTAKDFGLNLLQEATFGGADEAMGFLGGEGVREEYLKELSAAQERSPYASGLGGVTGSVATGLIPGGQVGKGAQLGQLAGRDLVKEAAKLAMKQSAMGAAQGGATGFLSATDQPGQADSLGDRAVGGAVGTVLGGALGALPGAVTTTGMVGRRVRENLPAAIAEFRHTPSSPFNPVALMAGPKGAVVEAARTQRKPALAAAKELFKPLPGPEPVRAPRQGFGPAPAAIEAPEVSPEMTLVNRFGQDELPGEVPPPPPGMPDWMTGAVDPDAPATGFKPGPVGEIPESGPVAGGYIPERAPPELHPGWGKVPKAMEVPEAEPQMTLTRTDQLESGPSNLDQQSLLELMQGPDPTTPTPATVGKPQRAQFRILSNEPEPPAAAPKLPPPPPGPPEFSELLTRYGMDEGQQTPIPTKNLDLLQLQEELQSSAGIPSVGKVTGGQMPPGMSLADLSLMIDQNLPPAQKALQLVTEFGVTNETALSRLSGLDVEDSRILLQMLRTGASLR